MRKVFLAFVLLVLIIGVSYIKAIRDDDKAEMSFSQGQKAGQRELLQLKNRADSLRYSIGQREVELAESLTIQYSTLQGDIDSLIEIVEKQDKKIADLKKKLAEEQKKSELARKSNSGADKHKQLLAYYQKRYRSLPADLADYERTVAISEIRLETARRFSISLEELNRIRSQHNIDY